MVLAVKRGTNQNNSTFQNSVKKTLTVVFQARGSLKGEYCVSRNHLRQYLKEEPTQQATGTDFWIVVYTVQYNISKGTHPETRFRLQDGLPRGEIQALKKQLRNQSFWNRFVESSVGRRTRFPDGHL